MPSYHLAALGGTFDHLHLGHHTLLDLAFAQAQSVVIGLTQDAIVQYKAYTSAIEPYQQRLITLADFLAKRGYHHRATIEPLADLFGPTLTSPTIDCLVVSPLTHSGALVINQARQDRSLQVLPIHICHLEKSQDGEHISSTRIRQGLIDRAGFVYSSIFAQDRILTEAQKQAVRLPLGELLTNPPNTLLDQLFVPKPPFIISVGDATTQYLMQNALHPDVAIIDGKIQRQAIQTQPNLAVSYQTENPAGTITTALVQTITEAYLKPGVILVDGEEDLALLPAILLAPLGTVIFYGQPNEGMVVVKVTEERKGWVKKVLI